MPWWSAYPFSRFVLFFVIGILLETYTKIYTPIIAFFLCFLIVIFWIITSSKSDFWKLRRRFLGGLLACICLVLFGIFHTYHYNQINKKNHFITEEDSIFAYKALVSQEVENRSKTYRTVVSLQEIKTKKGWKNKTGKVLLYLKKNQKLNSIPLKYGDILLIKGQANLVSPPPNPAQFDYAKYLSYQNIFHQQFISNKQFEIINHTTPNYIYLYALQSRNYLSKVLKNLVKGSQEFAIATALLLGVREQMDSEILEAYSKTGLMHILAVSGMHVGLLVIFLEFFFFRNWLKSNNSKKRLSYVFLMLIIVWFYALITGLSPSVFRAVMMFSLMVIGKGFSKRPSIYNTLAVSLFVLLFIDPYLLFSAGLQLSYLAVWGIVYFQPIFNKYWSPSNRIVKWFWGIITVSLAAQLVTFPLGLWYFNQFPNYFLLSNLVIIPISIGVMYVGIMTLMLAWIPIISTFLGWVLSTLIWLMNYITFYFQKLPYANIEGVYVNNFEVLILYGMIICFAFFIHSKKYIYWVILGVLSCFWGVSRIFYTFKISQQNELIVYHFSGKTAYKSAKDKKQLFLRKVN